MFFIKSYKSLIVLFLLVGVLGASWVNAQDNRHLTNPKLKPYMTKFGTMFAGLELMYLKEKKIDWEVVNQSIDEMSKALSELQANDSEGRFKDYTSELSLIMKDLQSLAKKKSRKFFPALDKLDETCFKCHAVNRPSDFPVLKKSDQISQAK